MRGDIAALPEGYPRVDQLTSEIGRLKRNILQLSCDKREQAKEEEAAARER